MSKIKIFLGLLLALSFKACTDFVDPAIPYGDFETGVYLRTLSVTPNINFFNLSGSNFALTLEAVDAQNGALVGSVDIFAKRRRGPSLTSEVKLATIPGSDFTSQSNGSKYLGASFQMGIPQVLQALGMTEADVTGGDFIEFRLVLLTTDGRTFTNTNLSGDVSGGAYYASPFFYRIPVVCPSDLAGTFDYVQSDMFCDGEITGTVTWTAVPNTTNYKSSDFSFGSWIHCYGAGGGVPGGTPGLSISDACNVISVTGADQYGDAWTYTIDNVSGTQLTISWTNTYGEFGTVVLTRQDGKSWPPLRN